MGVTEVLCVSYECYGGYRSVMGVLWVSYRWYGCYGGITCVFVCYRDIMGVNEVL